MKKPSTIVILIASIVTVTILIIWQATGGDYYTKFEVVEQVEKPVDKDDPLADTGFYEGTSQTQVVARKEFRLGLLPTPQGIFDKHAVSVVSIAFPTWVLAIGLVWWMHRRRRSAP